MQRGKGASGGLGGVACGRDRGQGGWQGWFDKGCGVEIGGWGGMFMQVMHGYG